MLPTIYVWLATAAWLLMIRADCNSRAGEEANNRALRAGREQYFASFPNPKNQWVSGSICCLASVNGHARRDQCDATYKACKQGCPVDDYGTDYCCFNPGCRQPYFFCLAAIEEERNACSQVFVSATTETTRLLCGVCDAISFPATNYKEQCAPFGLKPDPSDTTITSLPTTPITTANSLITLPTITLTATTTTQAPPSKPTKPSTAECVLYAAEITLCQGAEDVSDLQGVLKKVCDPRLITALGVTSAGLVFTPAIGFGVVLSEATIALEETCVDVKLSGAADKILSVVNKICRSSDNSLADKASACGLLGRRQVDRSRRFFRHARRDVGTCALAVFPDPSITKGYSSLQSLCSANIMGTDPSVDALCGDPGFPVLVRFAQQVKIISELAAQVPAESCASVSGAVPSSRP